MLFHYRICMQHLITLSLIITECGQSSFGIDSHLAILFRSTPLRCRSEAVNAQLSDKSAFAMIRPRITRTLSMIGSTGPRSEVSSLPMSELLFNNFPRASQSLPRRQWKLFMRSLLLFSPLALHALKHVQSAPEFDAMENFGPVSLGHLSRSD